MRLITRDDIERWGMTYEAKGGFPILIARLVLATTPTSTRVRFPSGSAVFLSGWDGIVECEEETNYVPKGISRFELGTEKNYGNKIDGDYKKRTADPLGCDPKKTTLILITPYTWNDKEDWVNKRNSEGFWNEVRVYDAIDMEQWLDSSIVATRWFLEQTNKPVFDGILLAEESWDEWSRSPSIALPPEIIVTGRENEKGQLLNILQEKPSYKGIRASTRREAIAFIIACGKIFDKEESERFLSKTLVVENINDFRRFAKKRTETLNLIANIDNPDPFYSAVSSGHHVLVPLGAQDEFNQETIDLPILDRNGLVEVLTDLLLDEDKAKRYVLDSGRNITIIRKFLNFPELNIHLNQKKNIREIIPALILGRWSEGFKGDIELIELLSGEKYSEYSIILNEWKNYDDSPLMQIGSIWRLASPFDLWISLSKYLTKGDFDLLYECFRLAFFDGNPNIEPDNENTMPSFFKQQKYSNWSREGIAQSLILVGLHGDKLQIPHSQQWIDTIVYNLLFDASTELWISVDKELPLIAEASPKSFLSAISHSLEKEYPEIIGMFKKEDGLFGSNYHYTGLLWALEGLAWFPEFLGRVSLILLKLDSIIPKLEWVNCPMDSLVEIFKPWHYQTLTAFEERMEILKQITSKEKESGWNLLIKLLPQGHEIVYGTHKTRWRIFDLNTKLTYTYREKFDTYSFILDLLVNLFDNDEMKFSMLLENTVVFPYQKDRFRVYNWAEKVYAEIIQIEYKPWNTIREILHHHRSYPDADWSLPESELQVLDNLYHKLEPKSVVEKYKWLFNSYWPAFPEGNSEKDSDEQNHKKNKDSRSIAAKIWLEELGLNETVRLRKVIKEPSLLGEALADIIREEKDIITICECFKGDIEDNNFGQSFIRNKSHKENFDWVKRLVSILQKNGFDEKSISNMLVSVGSYREVWNYVESVSQELQDTYWLNEKISFGIQSSDDAMYVIKKLSYYNRYFTAIKVSRRIARDLPTNLLVDVLYKAVTEDTNEPVHFDRYDLNKIFEELYIRNDLDISLMIKIEWQYISLFDSYFSLKPKYLEDELASNPHFFIEVIKWIYFPNDRQRYYEDKQGIPEERVRIVAQNAKNLLDTWRRVPGMREDETIDGNKLKNWISEARELAKEADRLEVADMEIGELLSKLPEDSEELPSEEIFRVIEEINSKNLKSSYSSGLFNKRGSTVRSPFDGGSIEREHASFFNELAKKYRNIYPNVSEIFSDLEQTYLSSAQREDDQAALEGLEY